VNPEHADKIARMLARLDEATRPDQLDLPGFRLHPLKGELAGYWSITVRATGGSSSASSRARRRMPSRRTCPGARCSRSYFVAAAT
jgi:hypothetical protein